MKGGFFLCDDPPLLLAELGGEGERHEGMIEEFFHYKKNCFIKVIWSITMVKRSTFLLLSQFPAAEGE
jgi:hypothetical protein